MIHTRIAQLALGIALAVLMPLESAHCAFMGFAKASASAPSSATESHECCATSGASGAASKPAPQDPDPCSADCACFQIPVGVPVSGIALVEAPTSTMSAIVPRSAFIDAPRAIPIERVPALDVGSSPLLVDPGAHGLRAPPATA